MFEMWTALYYVKYLSYFQLWNFNYTFFYKSTRYKNTETQITQNLKAMTRLDARTPKKLQG